MDTLFELVYIMNLSHSLMYDRCHFWIIQGTENFHSMRRECIMLRKYLSVGMIWDARFKFTRRESSLYVVTFWYFRMLRMSSVHAVYFNLVISIFTWRPSVIHLSKLLISLIWTYWFIFWSERASYTCSGPCATFGKNKSFMTVIAAFWDLSIYDLSYIDILMRPSMKKSTKFSMNGNSIASYLASPRFLSYSSAVWYRMTVLT